MRQKLQSIFRPRSFRQSLVAPAKIIWMADDGMNNTQIARILSLSRPTVGKRRRRFLHPDPAFTQR